jgi:hypothetical protein
MDAFEKKILGIVPLEKPQERPIAKRFWSRVRKTSKCWIWTGTNLGEKKKYGVMRVGGKSMRAHRISWVIHFGSIPSGMCVCHKCDNPVCVRPDHLFLGTDLDNVKDRDTKGRTAKGERGGNAKLTERQVAKIRKRLAKGELHREIAKAFGVGRSLIGYIARNQLWKVV